MYKTLSQLIFFFIFISSTAQIRNDRSLKLPLLPVNADSVSVEDFFWYGQLQEIKNNFPFFHPTRLKSPKKEYKDRVRLSKNWHDALLQLEPTALPSGQQGIGAIRSAAGFLSLCSRLNLATADARYANIFEFVACNALCGRQQSYDHVERETAALALAGVPCQIYATSGEHLFVNCIIRNSAHIVTDKLDVKTTLIASRPWYNQVILWLKFKEQGRHMVLHIALPEGYEQDSMKNVNCPIRRSYYQISVGKNRVKPQVENGYLVFDRHWSDSDYVAIDFPIPNLRVMSGTGNRKLSIQRGPIVYSTLNVPEGMYIKAGDPIHSEFDKQRHTNVLSAPYYDAQGNKVGEYIAEPYLFNRDNPKAQTALPFLH